MVVARAEQQADPPVPVPVPAGLRRFVGFAHLPAAARRAVRRVVDDDGAFRERVASRATEELVGRAGWLWLARPDGWGDELAELVAAAAGRAEAAAVEREERSARKRAEAAEQQLERSRSAEARARRDADEARAALAEERHARRAAEALRAGLEARSAAAEAGRADADARAARAEEEARGAAAGAAGAAREADALRARLAAAEARAEHLEAERADLAAALDRAASGPAPLAGGSVAAALADASEAVHRLADALDVLAGRAGPEGRPPGPGPGPGPGGRAEAPSGRTAPGPPPRRPPGVSRRRRRPLVLPGGVLDDTREAVEHLLRVAGVLLLVDGYNVAKLGWPDLPLGEQRGRLLDALAGVAARTGSEIHVVFDGADVPAPVTEVARPVHVRFSPPGVEADDVLLALVDEVPPQRPVVVASDDHRVRDGARAGGANTVGARPLLDLLRR